jgi:phage shock protein E
MKAAIALSAVIFATTFAAHADEPKPATTSTVKHLDAAAAKKLVAKPGDANNGLVVLDVRTDEEFAKGHIGGAKQLNFFADDFEKNLGKLDKTKPYLLHCQSGGRSGKALKAMQKLGFEKVYHLDGGMLAWEKAGGAVDK